MISPIALKRSRDFQVWCLLKRKFFESYERESHVSARKGFLFYFRIREKRFPGRHVFFLFSSCVLELSLERELIVPSQLIITLVEAEDRIMYFERIGSSGF